MDKLFSHSTELLLSDPFLSTRRISLQSSYHQTRFWLHESIIRSQYPLDVGGLTVFIPSAQKEELRHGWPHSQISILGPSVSTPTTDHLEADPKASIRRHYPSTGDLFHKSTYRQQSFSSTTPELNKLTAIVAMATALDYVQSRANSSVNTFFSFVLFVCFKMWPHAYNDKVPFEVNILFVNGDYKLKQKKN